MQGPKTIPLVLGDWLQFEEDGHYSRENIVIKSGEGALKTGTVLGRIAVGAGTAAMDGGNTGNATFGAVTVGAGAITGGYVITFSAATKYEVEDPNGVNIGNGTTGVAFSAGGLGFTITAGGTPMAAGDRATISVAAGTGVYVAFDTAATTGGAVAVGILIDPVDATDADTKAAALVRHATIAPSGLVWKGTPNTNQKNAALAQLRTQGILQLREA